MFYTQDDKKFCKNCEMLQAITENFLQAIINIHQFLNIHIKNSYAVFKTKSIIVHLRRFEYIFW